MSTAAPNSWSVSILVRTTPRGGKGRRGEEAGREKGGGGKEGERRRRQGGRKEEEAGREKGRVRGRAGGWVKVIEKYVYTYINVH
jgi:hypothetical protein